MGINYKDLPEKIRKQVDKADRKTEVRTRPHLKSGKQSFFINELPPMLNGQSGLQRMHWSAYQKIKEKWIFMIAQKNLKAHKGEVNITFTRKSVRSCDPDNAAAGFKVIGDALVANSVLRDDSFKIIKRLDVKWEKAKTYKGQGVRIEIEDIN